MDNQIKEVLRSMAMTEILDSPQSGEFLSKAVAICSKAKSAKIKNSAQAVFFAIHLTSLTTAYTVDPLILQKKSALQAKDYQNSLVALLNLIDPTALINPETVSRYYKCPLLKGLIEDIQRESKDFSPITCLAAVYLIDQKSKMKLCGTIKTISTLWAHSAEEIKSTCTLLGRVVDGPEMAKKIADVSKLMATEMKQNNKRKTATTSATTTTTSKRSSTGNTSTSYPTTHPLAIFNCSFSGPSFGPILFS